MANDNVMGFNLLVEFLKVQAGSSGSGGSTGISFQSLSRDSEGSSALGHSNASAFFLFQSLSRDSEGSSDNGTPCAVVVPAFQSLSRDSEGSSAVPERPFVGVESVSIS